MRCPSCGAQASAGSFCGVCGMRLVTAAPAPAIGTATAIAKGFTPLPPSTILHGRYRVGRALASGAMGAVYRAEDLQLGGQPRALKELLQHWGTPEERAEAESWFLREGVTLKSLQHPAIPLVHDIFSEGQRHYLVMDLVEGRSLEQVLVEEGRPSLPQDRVLDWAEQVLDVLSYLHSRPDPLIFRDLKPANLMLTPQGNIRLIDFGIARVLTREAQGTAIGTPGYAPPEQYQGLAEPASDLYALGATMHHLLTGRDPRKHRPFDFPPVRTLAPEVSPAVAAAIDRSLALDPRARQGTAADLRKALRGTSGLDGSSKRTITGTLARGHTGSGMMPALAGRGNGAAATINGTSTAMAPHALKLHPHELRIVAAGSVTLTPIDKRTVRLRNRTDQRLLLTFDSDVQWLRPDRPAAWLEPKGKLEVALSVMQAQQRGRLNTMGNFRVQEQGGQIWAVPVRLQVRGSHAVAVPSVRGGLARIASLCFMVGLVTTVLGAAGMHVLSGSMAWDLLVAGLVGRVVLRVLRGEGT